MSLYNLINGVRPSTFFVLPMLGKHPDEYPRFRDCFVGDDEHPEFAGHIHVYTRTGGGNRDDYIVENQAIRDMDGFVADYDDSFDSTFASWVFRVPERWRPDYEKITTGKVREISAEYKAERTRKKLVLSDVRDLSPAWVELHNQRSCRSHRRRCDTPRRSESGMVGWVAQAISVSRDGRSPRL